MSGERCICGHVLDDHGDGSGSGTAESNACTGCDCPTHTAAETNALHRQLTDQRLAASSQRPSVSTPDALVAAMRNAISAEADCEPEYRSRPEIVAAWTAGAEAMIEAVRAADALEAASREAWINGHHPRCSGRHTTDHVPGDCIIRAASTDTAALAERIERAFQGHSYSQVSRDRFICACGAERYDHAHLAQIAAAAALDTTKETTDV